ncbi:signal peptidase I family protein, partial [Pholiota molesta]
MLPTFATSGEIILEDRFSIRHLNAPLVRGDLIVIESPIHRGRMVCKRLLGLPGDVVCVDPTGECAPSTEHIRVPEGHVWISGDNAAWSRDSRVYGPVPIALVKGRIIAKVWPPHKFTRYPSGSGITYL